LARISKLRQHGTEFSGDLAVGLLDALGLTRKVRPMDLKAMSSPW
jgi:hypothetical protein